MNDERLRRSYDMLLAIRADTGADRSACPPVERIAGLVRREEDEESRLALLDHVMTCPYCQHEFEMVRTASRATGDHPAPEA